MKAMDTELSSLRSFVEDVNEEVRNMRLVWNQGNVHFSSSAVGRESQVTKDEQEKDNDNTLVQNTSKESIALSEAEEEKTISHTSPKESGEKKKRKKKKKKTLEQPMDSTH